MKLKLILPMAVWAGSQMWLSAAVDFTKAIQPILEQNCLKCHGAEQGKGGLRLHTKAASITGGDSGTALVPGKSKDSSLYTTTTLPDDDEKLANQSEAPFG